MKDFDANNIDYKQRTKIKKIFDENPSLTDEAIIRISIAGHAFFLWMKAIYQYSVIYSEIIKPKKDQNDFNKKEEEKTKNKENSDDLEKESHQTISIEISKLLDSISKSSITELKSCKQPAKEVAITMQCVCILFNREPTWEESQQILSDPNLINLLKTYDKNTIDAIKIEKILKILDSNPTINSESLQKISIATASLFSWVKWLCDNYENASKNNLLQKECEEMKLDDPQKNEDKKNIIDSSLDKKEEIDQDFKILIEKTKNALSCITKSQIVEVKSLAKPPSMIALTLYLVNILLDNKIKNVIGVCFLCFFLFY